METYNPRIYVSHTLLLKEYKERYHIYLSVELYLSGKCFDYSYSV